MDRGDFVGIAALAVVESERRYDPRRGVKFNTYADRRARGAILDEIRKAKGRYSPRPQMVGEPHDEPAVPPAESVVEVEELLASIPQREAAAIRLTALDGHTYEVAGRILGVTGPRVWQLTERARGRLRRLVRYAG
jgi:RNA polymerase sigma factor (sigma-70 family)